MIAALAFLRSPLGMMAAGALAIVLYTGAVWVKATAVANDAWRARVAAITEQVRAEAAARNRKVEEELRILVDVQTKARLEAEQESEDLRNALSSDKSDTTVRVGPELDRVLGRALYPGGVAGAPGAAGH